jgi:GLEYA domain
MDSCASFTPCNSVDYHQSSQTCYYSKHHGEPTIVTPGFSSAYSLGCTGACSGNNGSCCSCGTGTSPMAPVPTAPDLSCGNQGFQYAIYPNKRDGTSNAYNDDTYSNFNEQVFKTSALEYSGKTAVVGVSDTNLIYGNKPSDFGHVAVNHRGYVFAKEDGDYTFTFSLTDNISLLWVGSNAYSGYTRANANIVQHWLGTGGGVPKTYKTTFQAGKYYPIRVLFGNGGGPGYFGLRLTAPDGTVIIGDGAPAESPYLVQYSCDKTSAPRFPPFGNEK